MAAAYAQGANAAEANAAAAMVMHPAFNPALTIKGPSAASAQYNLMKNRERHEKTRPKRTTTTYAPFFEKSWKPFCDAVDGGELDGIVIEGKPEQWDYWVNPLKTFIFMSAFGLKRMKRKGGSGPRRKESVRSDLCAIRDIYEKQKSCAHVKMEHVGHPRVGNVPLQTLLQQYDVGEKDRRDTSQAEQSGIALCDGEFYSAEQHLQVLEFGLKKDGNPAANGVDEFKSSPGCGRITRSAIITSCARRDELARTCGTYISTQAQRTRAIKRWRWWSAMKTTRKQTNLRR